MSSELITARQLSQRLGVGESTLRHWARRNWIPAYQVQPGGALRFDEQEVRAALVRHPAEPAALAAAGGPKNGG
jgi:excisionase family DNA binding protein